MPNGNISVFDVLNSEERKAVSEWLAKQAAKVEEIYHDPNGNPAWWSSQDGLPTRVWWQELNILAAECADINLEGRFTVAGSGAAWFLRGYATEWTEESWELACDNPAHIYGFVDVDDELAHNPECYVYYEPEEIENREKVRATMVGDDRVEIFDVDDLTEITEEDYCPGCGQLGCGAYGNGESES